MKLTKCQGILQVLSERECGEERKRSRPRWASGDIELYNQTVAWAETGARKKPARGSCQGCTLEGGEQQQGVGHDGDGMVDGPAAEARQTA